MNEFVSEIAARFTGMATHAAKLAQHAGLRIDALSMDLARDIGVVMRSAQSIVRDAQAVGAHAASITRATPRVMQLAKAGAAILARQRWLRLRMAARGDTVLSEADHRDLAQRVVTIAGELRGGIAKLGQLASVRADLVGPIWASELATLQDRVPPVDTAAIRARIEAELGAPITEVFREFTDEPLAAASLAQVHAAVLLDGTPVAVKVQVPGIEDVIAADIAALRAVADGIGELPGIDLPTLTSELARALADELDYEAEAKALDAFALVAPATIRAPRPIAQASTGRVLTMTRIDGERITTYLDRMLPPERDRVLQAFVDEMASQILVRGVVHADPHPGNVLVDAEGTLALLDFGCTLTLTKDERRGYARLVLGVAGGTKEAIAKELAALGFVADDPAVLVELASSLVGALKPGAAVATLDWEQAVAAQLAAAKRIAGLSIPRSFVLLGRVLATLAGLLATYKPRLELFPLLAPKLASAAM